MQRPMTFQQYMAIKNMLPEGGGQPGLRVSNPPGSWGSYGGQNPDGTFWTSGPIYPSNIGVYYPVQGATQGPYSTADAYYRNNR